MQILFQVPTVRKRSFFVTIPTPIPLQSNATERDSTRMQLRTLTVYFFAQITLEVLKTLLALRKVVNRRAVASDMQMRFFFLLRAWFLTPGRCGCAAIVILGDPRDTINRLIVNVGSDCEYLWHRTHFCMNFDVCNSGCMHGL